MLDLQGVRVDLPGRRVWRGDAECVLTSTEASLLAYLAANPRRDIPRAELLQRVWGYSPDTVSRTVDTIVRRLRRKIEVDPASPHHLLTVYGVGYRFEPRGVAPIGLRPVPGQVRREGGALRLVQPDEAVAVAPRVHHLPAERDGFVGRVSEQAALLEALDSARLVTVFGLGGMGKTRLARHFAQGHAERWPGGVWFCDLLASSGVTGIVRGVARALDVPLGADPVDQLGHAIDARGECLIILDNFEQVAEHAEATIGRWLEAARGVRFLVTSRRTLGIRGEAVIGLQGLPVPHASDDTDAVALLRQRARAAVPGWQPEAQPLAELARRLEGIPLALELAAARLRTLSVQQLLDRLDDRFRWLAVPASARPARHATLRAVLDDSFARLEAYEAAALAQLSVCEGSFTLELAEAVVDLSPWPEAPFAADVVAALVEQALVVRTGPDRLSMLVSVQEYAAGALEALGPGERRAAEVRHGRGIARLGSDEVFEYLGTAAGAELWRTFDVELDNLDAAVLRAIDRGDGPVVAQGLRAMLEVEARGGSIGLCIGRGGIALERMDLAAGDRAMVAHVVASSLRVAGRFVEAQELFQHAHALWRAAGDLGGQAGALHNVALCAMWLGDHAHASALLTQALALYRRAEDRAGERATRVSLGRLAYRQGDYEQARAQQAARSGGPFGSLRDRAIDLHTLGNLYSLTQDHDEARECYEAALQLNRTLGDRRGEARNLANLGSLEARQGRNAEARGHYVAAVTLQIDIGDVWAELFTRLGHAMAEMADGRLAEAAALLDRAEVLCPEEPGSDVATYLMVCRGELAHRRGDDEQARTWIAAAEGIEHRSAQADELLERVRALLNADR